MENNANHDFIDVDANLSAPTREFSFTSNGVFIDLILFHFLTLPFLKRFHLPLNDCTAVPSVREFVHCFYANISAILDLPIEDPRKVTASNVVPLILIRQIVFEGTPFTNVRYTEVEELGV